MKQVAVFRHQMFKLSEPFITQQSEQLRNFRPVYLGRDRFGGAPAGSESHALTDMPDQRRFHRRLWQVLTRDPGPYLQLLGDRRLDLIHAHFGVDGIYALPLARKLDVPLVTTFHGYDATTRLGALLRSGSPAAVNYALFRHQLAQQGDLFLCGSEFIRRKVLALGFPEDRTLVHYTGIDTDRIMARSVEAEPPTLLHVARLVEVKGTEYLLRAFAQVVHAMPAVQLQIIGDGPLRPSLEQLAQSLGIAANLQFLGARPHVEVMAALSGAAMLILPSVSTRSGETEGLGMVLLEAAAMGVPAIGTKNGGIPEVVMDGRTGFLVAERAVDELAQRILALLESPEDRRSMGQQARVSVRERFSIAEQTQKLEGHYREVMA